MAHRSRFVAAVLLLGLALEIGVLVTSLASARAEPREGVRCTASPRRQPPWPTVTIPFPEPGPGVLVTLGLLGIGRIIVRRRGLNA